MIYGTPWTAAASGPGMAPSLDFDTLLDRTVQWYVDHPQWWQEIRNESGFRSYYKKQYDERYQN